jgi:sarcosine oxidase subunit delta
MIISCPFCGDRSQHEFSYWHEAETKFPTLDGSAEAWAEAVYQRVNPAGRANEIWHHALGCRSWLRIERNTLTHQIYAVEPAKQILARAVEPVR